MDSETLEGGKLSIVGCLEAEAGRLKPFYFPKLLINSNEFYILVVHYIQIMPF